MQLSQVELGQEVFAELDFVGRMQYTSFVLHRVHKAKILKKDAMLLPYYSMMAEVRQVVDTS